MVSNNKRPLSRKLTLGAIGIVVVFVAGVGYFSLQGSSPSASTLGTCEVSDPKGDVGSNPPYLDIVTARIVTLSGNQLRFEVVAADQIPKQPSGNITYVWFLTSDLPKLVKPGIALRYDSQTQRWDALIANNTVATTPGQARGGGPAGARNTVATGLTFATSGSTANVIVPLDLLGNPTSFTWHSVSRTAPLAQGIPHTDKAPDQADAKWPCK